MSTPQFRRPSLSILIGLALAGMAQAQTQLPTVTVSSSPERSDGLPLAQVPSNLQTVKVERGSSNLADLLNEQLGSVSVSNGTGNPYQNDINYRGLQASSLLGAPVGLSVYLDGVRMNEPFGDIVNWDLIPLNAITSVELLPGSNPVFGLNTLGGAIVVATKNGHDDAGLRSTLTAGSFRRRALQTEYGWSQDERGQDVFLAANLDRQDGYRSHSASDVRQFFSKARWHGNADQTQAELSFAYADNVLHGTQALPLSMLSDPRQAYTWPDDVINNLALVNFKFKQTLSTQSSIQAGLYHRRSNASSANSNANLDDGCYDASGNLTAECTQITGGTGTAPNSLPTNPLGLARYTADINADMIYASTHQGSTGLSLNWESKAKLGGLPNLLTLGWRHELSNIDYAQNAYLARLLDYQTVVTPNLRYYFPSTGSSSGSNLLASVNLSGQASSQSLYLSDYLTLADALSLNLAASYAQTRLQQNGSNQQYLNQDGGYHWTDAVTGVDYYNPSYVGAQYVSGSKLKTISSSTVAGWTAGPESNSLLGQHRYQRLSPAVGLAYSPGKTSTWFANYTESMRAPTIIELSCANPNQPCALPTGFNGDPDLKAVVAKTIEFGGRGRLADTLHWNAALYRTRLSNDIQFDYSGSSGLGYFSNVGDTQRQGLELGANWQVAGLTLAANYGYVAARYRSSFTDANGDTVQSGKHIPGIAPQTLKLAVSTKPSAKAWVRWSVVAAGPQYAHGDEANLDPSGPVPGYAVHNLDLQYQCSDAWSLALSVKNVFDKRYATFGVLGTNVYSGANEAFRTPAAPRGLWLGLNYSWGGLGGRGSAD